MWPNRIMRENDEYGSYYKKYYDPITLLQDYRSRTDDKQDNRLKSYPLSSTEYGAFYSNPRQAPHQSSTTNWKHGEFVRDRELDEIAGISVRDRHALYYDKRDFTRENYFRYDTDDNRRRAAVNRSTDDDRVGRYERAYDSGTQTSRSHDYGEKFRLRQPQLGYDGFRLPELRDQRSRFEQGDRPKLPSSYFM